jgi:phosphoserine aminotransferase
MENGLYDFKGHRAMGGFRASLFYPVSDEAADRLIEFLDHFGEKCS